MCRGGSTLARIPGVSPREAGPAVAGTLGYAREMMAQLAERVPVAAG
jgi:hypothetical protein